jgi:Peptidase_C39 like family
VAAAAGAALLAPLGGCASSVATQSRSLRRAPPAGLPAQAELSAVPFFAQTRWHCGPAALAMVLGHAGLAQSPDALARDVFLPAREGALQVEMLAGARRHGAFAVELPGRLEALLQELAAGHPVVVLQNLSLAIAPRWHYAVLVGHDLTRSEVILRSGEVEREVLGLSTFELTWARSGYWAFVALPPGHLPVTADEAALLAAAIAFERSAPPASATRVYAALLQRWPDSLNAAIGLGNTRHAAGDLRAAAHAFEAAATRHDSAAAWNNLAQTRLGLGDRAAAWQAALRAVERAEAAEPQWLATARQTLQATLE